MLNNLVLYQKLIDLLKAHKTFLLLGIITSFLAAGTDAGLAAMLEPMINQGFSDSREMPLTWIGVAVIAIMTIRATMFFSSEYSMSRVSRGMVRMLRSKLFSHMIFLPQKFFKQHSVAKLCSMMTFNIEQMASAATEAMITVFREGFKALGLLIVMFYYSWQLSCLFIIVAPLLGMIGRYSSKRMRRLGYAVQESVADLNHVTKEAVEAHDLVKVYQGHEQEIHRINKAAQANYSHEMRLTSTSALASALIQIVASLPLAVIMVIAMSGQFGLNAGSFSALVAAMLMLLPTINRLTRINSTLQKGLASAEVVFQVINEAKEQETQTNPKPPLLGSLRFDNVSFAYPNKTGQLFKDLSFEVQSGQTVAIVGPSGVGKSTIISLILRLIQPNTGSISLNEHAISRYALRDYRQMFSYVGQDIQLFSDTISHNVLYGCEKPAVSVKKALEMASALGFVNELPGQEECRIGYRGHTLSGGQKQRIAIARAFMRQAPFLILDEATSALDNQSEREIQGVLETLMQQSTTIVIAHRLSTIQNADKIIVLDYSGIVESGTHQELIENNDYYVRLYHGSERPVCLS